MRRQILLTSLVVVLASLPFAWAVKCYDCVGADCMANFCEGSYCALGKFVPRWGSLKYGDTNIVKGCMNGTLLRKDVRSHCEVAEDDEDDVFTCFCNNKDNCNGGYAARKLPVENVELIKCQCTGDHCQGKTCIGEMCSYVYNHITKEVERGCVNASIPLLERRSMGSCMLPPVTGAMHHSVATKPNDLLMTESCICGTEFCNIDKPETKVPETMTCPAGVSVNIKGNKVIILSQWHLFQMKATNRTCTGEFCFKVEINSTLGPMKQYLAMGCATFTGEDDLAEELNPTGCANFKSEKLSVSICYMTKDEDAKGRARAKQKITSRGRKGKGRGKNPSRKEEEEGEEEQEGEEEEERQEKPKEEEEEREEFKEAEKNEKKEESKEEKEEKAVSSQSKEEFIFEEPTEAPIPDESNATMITVFILIMLCIVVSGAVWKFELHKKLFRSSYDTVAGG